MTSEQEADLAELKRLQKEIHDGTHELLNILAILRGEVDLAAERARAKLETFYRRFPEMRA
jgi:hypothetical protein